MGPARAAAAPSHRLMSLAKMVPGARIGGVVGPERETPDESDRQVESNRQRSPDALEQGSPPRRGLLPIAVPLVPEENVTRVPGRRGRRRDDLRPVEQLVELDL